ncbi:hypothetical protein M0802_001478, partial [Mischocyttarus mexicanus]
RRNLVRCAFSIPLDLRDTRFVFALFSLSFSPSFSFFYLFFFFFYFLYFHTSLFFSLFTDLSYYTRITNFILYFSVFFFSFYSNTLRFLSFFSLSLSLSLSYIFLSTTKISALFLSPRPSVKIEDTRQMEIQRRENARIHVSRFLSRSLSLRENDSRRNPPINTFSFRSLDTTSLPSSESVDRVTEPSSTASSLPNENISLAEPQEEKIDTRVGVVGEYLPPINNSSTSSNTTTTTSTNATTTTTASIATTTSTTTTSSSIPRATTDQGINEKQAVGEWNSLPVLVEHLRSVLEFSLAIADTSSSSSSSLPIKEDSQGLILDLDDSRKVPRPMDERSTTVSKISNGKEQDLKNDLRFLEDLLMSDIHTALSRLRETLERIDVGALAKQGAAASDPTSKLQLLRLVSSLLSRLEMPRESLEEEKKILSQEEKLKSSLTTTTTTTNTNTNTMPSLSSLNNRRRRGSRHTIGVSAEELACARKWLLEEKNFQEVTSFKKITPSPLFTSNTPTKSLRPSIDSRDKLDNTEVGNVEVGRVGRLAAALQQRVESSSKCTSSNRFISKKSKIKRANTIDIPSYLKLQADSLKQEGTGCVSLKKPINVGDKANCNSIKNMIVPSFQPRTENDRKFMALISKNNDTPIFNPPASFKSFGYTKTMDSSTVSNENWNSRFSNIKTAFDKTTTTNSGDESEQPVNKNKLPKRPPIVPQVTQRYNPPGKEKPFNVNVFRNFEHDTPPNVGQSISPGFRHAPSSPFRRIEKPTIVSNFIKPLPIPNNPPKSNIPMPGNTLREKARKMFDRGGNNNSNSNVQQRAFEYKVHVDGNSEKRTFPRPPWIEHDKPSNLTIAENGRLDYRSFCKQFAPFVSKGISSSSSSTLEKTPYELLNDDSTRQNSKLYQPRNELISEHNHSNVVDGKISLQMIPKDYNRYNNQGTRDSRDFNSETETTSGSQQTDITLRGSASVAVQTGIQDETTYDDSRSFRVVPKISNGPPLICSNVSIQTSSDVPSTNSDDISNYLLDNQKNHDEEKSVLPLKENVREAIPFNDYCSETIVINPHVQQNQTALVTIYDEPIPKVKENEHESTKLNYTEDDRSKSKDYDYLDAKNIQNQDISEEEGVVTRYTCAIATVATVDSPNIQDEVVEPSYFRDYSTPSVSPVWSNSRSKGSNDEEVDDEIRRHNMLQQSLIQRLHHERCTMIDRPFKRSPIDYQNETHGNTKKEQQTLEQEYYVAPRTNEYIPIENVNRYESISPSSLPNQSKKRIVDLPQAKKFLSPNLLPTKQTQIAPTTSRVVNQVSALRGVYEQPVVVVPNKPIRKERSPISNGTNKIDSSDEYLMSCANQPSRSIVLSKSESWHQLALSNSSSRIPRTTDSSPSSLSRGSYLPKPPKPRSPSAMKFRTKQYEASSDSVKKMEDKIRRYFDSPHDNSTNETKESKKRSSPRHIHGKCMIGLSRSRTLPGICEQKLVLTIPPTQVPLLQVNSADVDKVFDDIFQEATRMDGQHC